VTTNRTTLNHLRHELHTPLNHIIGYSEMLLESASEGSIVIGDVKLPAETREALRTRFDYEEARRQNIPLKFSCPSMTMREGETNSGATEPIQPWGDAVAEG